MGRWGEIPNFKHQVPNKHKYPKFKFPRQRVGIEEIGI
jgi:hypothetical protein